MKKILSLSLSLILSLSFATQTFASRYYSDIKHTDWFYNDVIKLSDENLVNGYEDGTFRPNNYITKAEAIKLIIPMSNTRILRSSETEWYSDYLYTALVNNFCTQDFKLNINEPITRFEMAELLVKSMKLKMPETKNIKIFDDTENSFATTLYNLELMVGMNENGLINFKGEKGLTRAEMVTILRRVLEDQKKAFFKEPTYKYVFNKTNYQNQNLSSKYKVVEYKDNKIKRIVGPKTYEEFKDIVYYMISNNLLSIELDFSDTKSLQCKDTVFEYIETIFNEDFKLYLESTAPYDKARINTEYSYLENPKTGEIDYTEIIVTLELLLGEGIQNKKLNEYETKTLQEAVNLYYQLREEGKITDNMSEYNKAKAYYVWFIENITYDELNKNLHTTHLPYSIFTQHAATCEGYTGAYNLLLKLEGIKVGFKHKDNHIWSLANLDGKIYEIDATATDNFDPKNFKYFALSEQEMIDFHILSKVRKTNDTPVTKMFN